MQTVKPLQRAKKIMRKQYIDQVVLIFAWHEYTLGNPLCYSIFIQDDRHPCKCEPSFCLQQIHCLHASDQIAKDWIHLLNTYEYIYHIDIIGVGFMHDKLYLRIEGSVLMIYFHYCISQIVARLVDVESIFELSSLTCTTLGTMTSRVNVVDMFCFNT